MLMADATMPAAMRRNTKVVPAPRQAQRRLMLSHRRARSE
jgi:hypothetical protein